MFDAIIIVIITCCALFGIKWLIETYFTSGFEFYIDYYLLYMVAVAVFASIYYFICCRLCLKKYNELIKSAELTDTELYDKYKKAEKCCQYRVNGKYVFVNTTHGIICMLKSDIVNRHKQRIKHTRSRRRRVNGYTRSVTHLNEYYTYHYIVETVHGTFKSNVANDAILEKLSALFT